MAFANWTLSEAVDHTAFFEEEEDDQYEEEELETRTTFDVVLEQDQKSDCLECKELVLCIGNAANAFVDIFIDLENYQKIASINTSKNESKTPKNKKLSCHIYKSSTTLVIQLKYHIEPKDFFKFTTALLNSVKCKQVHVLCSLPKYFLHSRDSDHGDTDVLRCLRSKDFVANEKTSTKIPTLEEGNIIKDIPASVFNHCNAYNTPCSLYMAYTESHFVDGFTLKCFQSLLQEVEIPKQVPDAVLVKRLRNFEGCGAADNVYT